MKKTFVCDDSMIITIPIGGLTHLREEQLMPEKFQCVYKDFYKVFTVNGKPKPLGAAQAIVGVFIVTLGLIFAQNVNRTSPEGYYIERDRIFFMRIYTLPSVLFLVSGLLSFAAGRSPNIHVTKLSFSLNIIGFFWSILAIIIGAFYMMFLDHFGLQFYTAVSGLVMALLFVENIIALFLIYWLSKAVCRQHFNTLPIILLKQTD